jgi:small subunit ribosomal protein S9
MVKQETAKAKIVHRYVEGVGRRKTAVARVRVASGAGDMTVNGKSLESYFQLARLSALAASPLTLAGGKFTFTATVKGGGVQAQAEAIRHGLSRALVMHDAEMKKQLRAAGYLTRDPRMVERKKFGFKKARRAPQWQKR